MAQNYCIPNSTPQNYSMTLCPAQTYSPLCPLRATAHQSVLLKTTVYPLYTSKLHPSVLLHPCVPLITAPLTTAQYCTNLHPHNTTVDPSAPQNYTTTLCNPQNSSPWTHHYCTPLDTSSSLAFPTEPFRTGVIVYY